MIEYLSFECCKKEGASIATNLSLGNDNIYYLTTYTGFRGMYVCRDDTIQNYSIESAKLLPLITAIEKMKIYSWKKTYPVDYVPGNHLMGCDMSSWSLSYKEVEKKTTRHIHGKGDPRDTFPHPDGVILLDGLFPQRDLEEWLKEK